jgi:mannose-1-phosphate guanylyltransferase
MVLPGYWMDIGQPHDYLSGQTLYLKSQRESNVAALADGSNIQGNVIIDSTATIDETALIGPNVVIGPGCKVGAGCRISNSTLLEGSKVDNYSFMDGSILG